MTQKISIRRLVPLLVLAAVIAAPVHAAQKRRAVTGSAAPVPLVNLKGQVVDSATAKPVIDVSVTSPYFTARTNQGGFFTARVPAGKPLNLKFERAGYQISTQSKTIAADTTATFQITSKPTLKVTVADGTVYDLDAETVEFGHGEGFVVYRAPVAKTCSSGGQAVDLDWSQIRRIPGAAVWSDNAACCAGHQIEALTVQLVSGESKQLFFKDSCPGYEMQLVAHDHVTNQVVFVPLKDLTNAVFP